MTRPEETLATEIREHLRMIASCWKDSADPMNLGAGGSSGAASRMPASTVELRADVVLTLAFWVHQMVAEWPALLDVLVDVPVPTTDPKRLSPWMMTLTQATVDCTDVVDMTDLLQREADRLAGWGKYGATLAAELGPLASALRFVQQPPRRDKVKIGDCPKCSEPVLIPTTRRVPQPTTNPARYPAWTRTSWAMGGTSIIRHKCGIAMTLDEWHEKLVGRGRPLTAEQLVKEIHARIGVKCSPITVRVWARRGMFTSRGYARSGQALYDLREVLEALIARDSARVAAARMTADGDVG